jgi:uncharacterized protein (TIGR02246 family)
VGAVSDTLPIRATFDRFTAAWNAHDAAAMARCWAESGTVTHPWGRFAAGRVAVEELLRGEHDTEMAASRYRFDDLRIRTVEPDRAVVDVHGVIEGVRAPNGRPYDLEHQITALLARDGEEWMFLTLAPSLK